MPSRARKNARRQGKPDPKARRPKVKLPELDESGRTPKPDQAIVDKLKAYQEKRLGRPVCGAWKPVKGGVCCKWPMRGHRRCEDDGGLTPRGVEAGSFRVGIFSDVIKEERVLEKYRRIHADKRLMDLREQVGLATHILLEMVEELYEGVPPSGAWQDLKYIRQQIIRYADDQEKATALVGQLLDTIDEGFSASEKREDIRKQQDHIRKLNSTERRHLDREKETMSVEAFMVNMAILAAGMRQIFGEDEIKRFKHYMRQNIMDLPGTNAALHGEPGLS